MSRWVDVCDVEDLVPDRGAGALVGAYHVAVFRLSSGEIYALGNHDPFSGANVLARGIVGSAGDVAKVASPIYKQAFDLRTGVCLSDPDVRVPVFATRVNGGRIELSDRPVPPARPGTASADSPLPQDDKEEQ
ncbi:MAG TPA: nitrite reductase small subunit NirD [Acidimicrobiales bacterium]|nr:nitrite reductase small subunit NirD [Acidimicrobiales bacterium]